MSEDLNKELKDAKAKVNAGAGLDTVEDVISKVEGAAEASSDLKQEAGAVKADSKQNTEKSFVKSVEEKNTEKSFVELLKKQAKNPPAPVVGRDPTKKDKR